VNCPKCQSRTSVNKTIIKRDFVVRFRKCNKCNYKFKTKELATTGWDYKQIVLDIKDMLKNIK